MEPLQKLQTRILKIIGIEDDVSRPLDIRQVFALKSVVYNYSDFKTEFSEYPKDTRFKSVELPKYSLNIGQNCYTYFAKNYFNNLLNKYKTLKCTTKELTKKLKDQFRSIEVT